MFDKNFNTELLEKTKIDWSSPRYNDGEIQKCYVAGCEYDVGLTIKRISDEQEMSCFNGPSSPNKTSFKYDASFWTAVEMLKKGFFDVKQIDLADGNSCGYGGLSACAFSS